MAEEISNDRARRRLAGAFALCSLATLTLLASHPGSSARTFADLLREEAHSVRINGLVHGALVVTLAALIVCFVLLSRRLGSGRPLVVGGLIAFCIGCGLMIASMILDGFVTPALAVRFADSGSTDNLTMARTLFILCGTIIGFLMPFGVLFQSAATLCWSVAIVKGPGLRRSIGVFGLLVGLIPIIAVPAVPSPLMTHVLLAAVVLQAIWYLALAALLSSRASWPAIVGTDGSC
ncbi:MAG TPA: hypothetical protein VET46_01670 [Steroidobacteraceae bacterium]|nr:hypothetical protein [Steroidobacteraceae bacterium]